MPLVYPVLPPPSSTGPHTSCWNSPQSSGGRDKSTIRPSNRAIPHTPAPTISRSEFHIASPAVLDILPSP